MDLEGTNPWKPTKFRGGWGKNEKKRKKRKKEQNRGREQQGDVLVLKI